MGSDAPDTFPLPSGASLSEGASVAVPGARQAEVHRPEIEPLLVRGDHQPQPLALGAGGIDPVRPYDRLSSSVSGLVVRPVPAIAHHLSRQGLAGVMDRENAADRHLEEQKRLSERPKVTPPHSPQCRMNRNDSCATRLFPLI